MDPDSKKKFEKFWELTSREKKSTKVPERQKILDLHNWGILNNLDERSPTLKNLLEDRAIIQSGSLPKDRDYTVIFKKIMEELNVTHTTKEMVLNERFKKENPNTKCVVIQVDTTPNWSFDGFGLNMNLAIEAASQKGIRFFITVSSNHVIF